MNVPEDRKYLESHEWHLVEGNTVTVGITQFAADQLSDITYVEMPKVGQEVSAGSVWGEIESVKATGSLYVGVSGRVLAVNEQLQDQPELVNSDPFQQGWMIKVEVADDAMGSLEALLSPQQYVTKYS